MKLIFPEGDHRSNGKPFNKKRRWLKQGAVCHSVPAETLKKIAFYRSYCTVVQFKGAPKGNFDIVSPEFLKEAVCQCEK